MSGGNSAEIKAFFKHLAEHDTFQLAVDTAFEEGKKAGRIEAMAERMLKNGFDIATIAELTELTTKEIEALNENIKAG
ncbi:MAG: hypothetical protein Q8N96_09910 [Methylovulum sp.]|nr:hypothetical protein [Methylovulum sp.]